MFCTLNLGSCCSRIILLQNDYYNAIIRMPPPPLVDHQHFCCQKSMLKMIGPSEISVVERLVMFSFVIPLAVL